MAERERKQKRVVERDTDQTAEDLPAPSAEAEKIKDELDDLLDEIDEVLETNAEEFVKNYIQKGGQ